MHKWPWLKWFRRKQNAATPALDLLGILNLGERANKLGLYNPPDLAYVHEQFGANCGPASFAALTRTTVRSVMPLFPHFPTRTWTTIGDMRSALRQARVDFRETGTQSPAVGLALVQLQTGNTHPIAILKNTHWVGVYGGCLYDVNWDGWLPVAIWERLIFVQLQQKDRRIFAWSIRYGLEFEPEPDCTGSA